ncbi:MAG: VCBS repeat-containing protein, partial [Planctomycetota bacterium]|nr:VCBS repeat-containing protein [Planctomycetota bacterium]
MRRFVLLSCAALLLLAPGTPGIPGTANAQGSDLADYFGFDGLEVIKIGRNAGPIASGDVNGDSLIDLIIVNNHSSRIELHLQKANATANDDTTPASRVNEFPEHWRYRRVNVPVTHYVDAVLAHDFDGDGLVDLIYAGRPSEIVFLRQTAPGVFKVTRRHRIRNLNANRDAF